MKTVSGGDGCPSSDGSPRRHEAGGRGGALQAVLTPELDTGSAEQTRPVEDN